MGLGGVSGVSEAVGGVGVSEVGGTGGGFSDGISGVSETVGMAGGVGAGGISGVAASGMAPSVGLAWARKDCGLVGKPDG